MASFMMLEELWDADRLKIEWVSLNNYDLSTMTEVIIKAINDQAQPKNLLISSYQKFVGNTDVQLLIKELKKIVDATNKQEQNTVAIATAWFVPAQMANWGATAIFNKEVYRLNDYLNIPRANLHKHLMRQVNDKDWQRMIRPSCWLEYQLGLSLGSTLSWEGLKRLKQCILNIFDYTFSRDPYRPPSGEVKHLLPPPLHETPGYLQDEYMMQILEDKGLYVPEEPTERGERLRCTVKRAPGWRYWDVYKKHGPMWTCESREGMLEAYLWKMNQSHSIKEWNVVVPQENMENLQVEETLAVEPTELEAAPVGEPVKQTKAHETDEAPVVKHVIKNLAEEVYDISMDDVMEIKDLSIDDSQDSDDSVFIEEEKGEKEKNKKNSNEMEIVKVLRRKLDEKSRLLEVAEEKLRSYKKESEGKETNLVREKATTKHYKMLFDKEREKSENLVKAIEREDKLSRHIKRQNKRITDEYDYLRGVYEGVRNKPYNSKLKLKHAKATDLEKYRDSAE